MAETLEIKVVFNLGQFSPNVQKAKTETDSFAKGTLGALKQELRGAKSELDKTFVGTGEFKATEQTVFAIGESIKKATNETKNQVAEQIRLTKEAEKTAAAFKKAEERKYRGFEGQNTVINSNDALRQQIIYWVQVRDSVERGSVAYSNAQVNIDRLNKTLMTTPGHLQKTAGVSSNVGQAMLSLNYIVRDSPYFFKNFAMGVLAVGNNINPFIDDLKRAIVAGGGFKGFLKEAGSFLAAGGWFTIGMSLAVTALQAFTFATEDAGDGTKKLSENLEELIEKNRTLNDLLRIARETIEKTDLTDLNAAYYGLTKEIKDLNDELQKQIELKKQLQGGEKGASTAQQVPLWSFNLGQPTQKDINEAQKNLVSKTTQQTEIVNTYQRMIDIQRLVQQGHVDLLKTIYSPEQIQDAVNRFESIYQKNRSTQGANYGIDKTWGYITGKEAGSLIDKIRESEKRSKKEPKEIDYGKELDYLKTYHKNGVFEEQEYITKLQALLQAHADWKNSLNLKQAQAYSEISDELKDITKTSLDAELNILKSHYENGVGATKEYVSALKTLLEKHQDWKDSSNLEESKAFGNIFREYQNQQKQILSTDKEFEKNKDLFQNDRLKPEEYLKFLKKRLDDRKDLLQSNLDEVRNLYNAYDSEYKRVTKSFLDLRAQFESEVNESKMPINESETSKRDRQKEKQYKDVATPEEIKNLNELLKKQDELKERLATAKSVATQLGNALVQSFMNGKLEVEGLLKSIAASIAQMFIMNAIEDAFTTETTTATASLVSGAVATTTIATTTGKAAVNMAAMAASAITISTAMSSMGMGFSLFGIPIFNYGGVVPKPKYNLNPSFNLYPKFEYGGVVPKYDFIPKAESGIIAGSSYSGDKVTIRANSGEVILNPKEQKVISYLMNIGKSVITNYNTENNISRSDDLRLMPKTTPISYKDINYMAHSNRLSNTPKPQKQIIEVRGKLSAKKGEFIVEYEKAKRNLNKKRMVSIGSVYNS